MPVSRDILTHGGFERAGPGSAPRIRFANGVSALALGLSGLFMAGDLEDGSREGEEGHEAFRCSQEPYKGRRKVQGSLAFS